ncbi:tRNA pseudouridine(38-40) synthase TruA [Gillisia sp. M10.2A]|uniref:tRNA pseudouridine synthase A n=1 Tax=Gillisia lutea TaxID=2909668 RepID=A0ABS9EJJ6_9FLAO|nr:tRNA pseudouridine(38-40) synthase TruA [Gillisia lutea]MCF4101658.1 tRNA pseudouridine(38-40) synthase TruA [Gillisia lutea]
MQAQRYNYLFKVQYLGYRLHGWQRQPKFKTVEGLIKKTFKYVLPERRLKILGASRTDAMVSANEAAFELFIYENPINDIDDFLKVFNKNLPQDIRAISMMEVDDSFNIIQNSKLKEYLYLFSYNEKNHPFCAPLMVNIQEELDIELMKKGAKIFEGTHYFRNYCADPSSTTKFERSILTSEIIVNTIYTANFFPDISYVYRVRGAGFLRYQIRLMMGSLIQLGKGEINLEDIKASLLPENEQITNYIAPASGLILNKIEFE